MKNNNKLYLFFAIVVLASFNIINDAIAQNVEDDYSKQKDYISVYGDDIKDTSIINIIKILYKNAPQYYNAPDMPRFAIVGNQHRFYLGIGGYLKGTLSYDLGNPIQNAVYFEPSIIPMNQAAGNGELVQYSVGTSNIFLNFVGLPKTKNQIGAYINFNFTGANNQYDFNLRAAYLTYRGLTVGYNTSLFTDAAACAPTIDQQGPNSWTFVFNTVLDYQYVFNKHWSAGIGLELPMVSATYNNYSYGVNQRIPDIPMYAQYSWKSGAGWLRLSGLIRNMYYRDNTTNSESTKDDFGYGVKLSGTMPLNNLFTLYYQGVYGKGISNYIQDIQGDGLDMVPVSNNNGKLENVEAWGAYMGVSYQITKKLLASATYSIVNSYLPKNSSMPSTTYKQAQYVVANVFYNITPIVTTGFEYLWGCRKNINDAFKANTRLQTVLRVNF